MKNIFTFAVILLLFAVAAGKEPRMVKGLLLSAGCLAILVGEAALTVTLFMKIKNRNIGTALLIISGIVSSFAFIYFLNKISPTHPLIK